MNQSPICSEMFPCSGQVVEGRICAPQVQLRIVAAVGAIDLCEKRNDLGFFSLKVDNLSLAFIL